MTSTSRNQLPNLYRVLVVLCLFSLSTQIALEPKVCLTQGCVHAASRMLEKMNQSADPCHDFYNYACGQFIADTIIPDSNAQVSMYTQLKDKVNHQIKALVSAPIEETEIEPFKKIKKFYASCLNFGYIRSRGVRPLLDIIVNEMGGWPVVIGNERWKDDNWTWQSSVKWFQKRGFSTDYFFSFLIGVDPKHSPKKWLIIDQPFLGLNREFLLDGYNSSLVQTYLAYNIDMAVLYGANRTIATKEMYDTLKFETELANITIASENRRNQSSLYNPTSIKELQQKYPFNNWLEYFNNLLPEVSRVTEDEIINVAATEFFEKLGNLLETTPKRVLANYVVGRVARSNSQVTRSSGPARFNYTPRWKHCLSYVISYFQVGVGAMYVRKNFKEPSKVAALEMVNLIKEQFQTVVRRVPWMDEATRAAALSKVKKMKSYIAYPDEFLMDDKLIEYYKNIEVDEKKYMESILSINVARTDRELRNFRNPKNKSEWTRHSKSALVNAYYLPLENSIELPAGILQGIFFSSDRPNYMNYGSIGSVIGHEISHGFDDKGSQFDADGNLFNWWKDETESSFRNKTRCIAEQYGNFTELSTNLTLNGLKTLGENIADNAGFKISNLAYKKQIIKSGNEKRLPSVDLTPEQLFWVSAAQTACSVTLKVSQERALKTFTHSPSRFRVNGPLSNLKEFSDDFQCPEGARMNPVKKCVVW